MDFLDLYKQCIVCTNPRNISDSANLLKSYYDRSSMQRGWSGDASMPTNGISLVTPTMTFLAGLKPLLEKGMITTVKTFWRETY